MNQINSRRQRADNLADMQPRGGACGEIPQRAGHSACFGMQIIHRRFKVRVAQDHLQIPHKSSLLQRVGGKRMS